MFLQCYRATSLAHGRAWQILFKTHSYFQFISPEFQLRVSQEESINHSGALARAFQQRRLSDPMPPQKISFICLLVEEMTRLTSRQFVQQSCELDAPSVHPHQVVLWQCLHADAVLVLLQPRHRIFRVQVRYTNGGSCYFVSQASQRVIRCQCYTSHHQGGTLAHDALKVQCGGSALLGIRR